MDLESSATKGNVNSCKPRLDFQGTVCDFSRGIQVSGGFGSSYQAHTIEPPNKY